MWVSYLISLYPLLFKNIAHVGSFMYFVFVLCLVSCVFVKCNAISTFVYKYLLLRRITKFIYTGRLSSWKLCLCPCIRLCVCLCLCLCHLQMNPGAVLFPTMYDMLIVMLESWKYWCLMMIGLVTEEEEEEEGGGGKSHCKVGTRWVRQKHKPKIVPVL